jgi:hypothetical protein
MAGDGDNLPLTIAIVEGLTATGLLIAGLVVLRRVRLLSLVLALVALVSVGVVYSEILWGVPNAGFEGQSLLIYATGLVVLVVAGVAFAIGIGQLREREGAIPRATIGLSVLAVLALAYSFRVWQK